MRETVRRCVTTKDEIAHAASAAGKGAGQKKRVPGGGRKTVLPELGMALFK